MTKSMTDEVEVIVDACLALSKVVESKSSFKNRVRLGGKKTTQKKPDSRL